MINLDQLIPQINIGGKLFFHEIWYIGFALIFISIGLYNLPFYLHRKNSKENLLFTLFCLAMGLSFLDEIFIPIEQFKSYLPIVLHVSSIAFYSLFIFGVEFFLHLFACKRNLFLKILYIVLCVFGLLSIWNIYPGSVMLLLISFFSIYVLYLPIAQMVRGNKEAKVIFPGALVMAITILHDVLRLAGAKNIIINYHNYVLLHPIGFLVLIICMSVSVASKIKRVYEMLVNQQKELDQKYLELSTVYSASRKLSGALDVEQVAMSTLQTILQVIGVSNGILYLIEEDDRLAPCEWVGLPEDSVEELRIITLNSKLMREIIDAAEPIQIERIIDIDDPDEVYADLRSKVQPDEVWIPLVSSSLLIGIISVKGERERLFSSSSTLDIVTTISSQAATALKNSQFFSEMQYLFIDSIKALSAAIDARDTYTSGHSDRVTEISVQIAEEMGLPKEQVELINFGGTLHDIGKIGIAEEILRKPGKLTDQEYEQMRTHPLIGANIILPIASLQEVIPLVLYHHERFDGRGYPGGLAGENIPLGARILAVADTYDAMTSDRVYRKGLPKSVAIDEIKRCSGTQFDPVVVKYFLEIYDDDSVEKLA